MLRACGALTYLHTKIPLDRMEGEMLPARSVLLLSITAILWGLSAGAADKAAMERASSRARNYLEANLAELGIASLESDLTELSVEVTKNGISIVRFQQLREAIPVYGAHLVVTMNDRDIKVTNGLVRGLNVNVEPTITRDSAEKLALKLSRLRGPATASNHGLLILPTGSIDGKRPSTDRLAWELVVSADNSDDGNYEHTILIDAHSGESIADTKNSRSAATTDYLASPYLKGHYHAARLAQRGTGPIDDFSRFYFYLQDACYGTGLSLAGYTVYPVGEPTMRLCGHAQNPDGTGYWVADALGNWVGDAGNRETYNGAPLKQKGNNTFGDGLVDSSDPKTTAADAAIAMYWTLRYLDLELGREGPDGANGPLIHILVRAPLGPNAAWSGRIKNCIQVGSGGPDNYPASSIDIIAHEIGHALSDYGPQLVKAGGEAAKLDEASANMFAVLASNFFGDPAPYRIGELTFKANWAGGNFANSTSAFTYMDDPVLSPGTVACYYAGIGSLADDHRGAGPANHMFYLLANGGQSKCNGKIVTGIGLAETAQIWFGSLYSLLPTSGYADLKAAFLNTSTLLFPGPSVETASVAAAFDAVNVP